MKIKKTKRGFSYKDSDGIDCVIQVSGIPECIRIGAEKIGLNVGYPWREVSKEEIKTKFNSEVITANNTMHLSRKQIKKLLPILEKFAKTGEL